ncbi:MAG: hypothetical protein IPO81_23155 [Kouleothrix sp.]|nr:hypothetical protein [Kouleothrix sp.]
MARNDTARRRALVSGAKVLLTAAAVAGTIGGWAAIGASDRGTAAAAPAQSDAPVAQERQQTQAPLVYTRRHHDGGGGTAPQGQPYGRGQRQGPQLGSGQQGPSLGGGQQGDGTQIQPPSSSTSPLRPPITSSRASR